jgi:poly(3-hydroxybutyrate) depolymerase
MRRAPWRISVVCALAAAACGASGGAHVAGAAGAGGSAGASAGGGAGAGGTTSAAGAGGVTSVGAGGASAGGAGAAAAGGTSATGGAGATGGGAGATGGGAGGAAGAGAGATPSKGCGTAAPAGGQATIDVAGTTREYILTLPSSYDASHPYRLVFAWHGRMYDAASVANGGPPGSGPYYGVQSLAGDSTIFVAPQALDTGFTNANGRDMAFVDAMVARFESQLCIDQSRIFSIGFSMGAIMTITIGCNEAGVFRAIAPMSGEIQGSCTDTHPIAYWASHGDADTTIPIAMGEAARDAFVSRNHCRSQTTPTSPAGCVSYDGCDPGAPVTWCVFSGDHEPAPFAGVGIWGFLSQY